MPEEEEEEAAAEALAAAAAAMEGPCSYEGLAARQEARRALFAALERAKECAERAAAARHERDMRRAG